MFFTCCQRPGHLSGDFEIAISDEHNDCGLPYPRALGAPDAMDLTILSPGFSPELSPDARVSSRLSPFQHHLYNMVDLPQNAQFLREADEEEERLREAAALSPVARPVFASPGEAAASPHDRTVQAGPERKATGSDLGEPPITARRDALRASFKEFVVNLHAGAYYTQLTSGRETVEVHMQLIDEMNCLKLDQGNGRAVEFPLRSVTRMYRVERSGESNEIIVVIEFLRKKLAFVFEKDVAEGGRSHRFLQCMELLVRKNHEGGATAGGGGLGWSLTTPRVL